MEVKTIEVCNASNINTRNFAKKKNLSRLLLAPFAKSTLSKGESKKKVKYPVRQLKYNFAKQNITHYKTPEVMAICRNLGGFLSVAFRDLFLVYSYSLKPIISP